MHAVARETFYSQKRPIDETPEFKEFQDAHASLDGYQGTVVADLGGGRFLTLTL